MSARCITHTVRTRVYVTTCNGCVTFTTHNAIATEIGLSMTSTCVGLGNDMSPPAGVAGRPVPGFDG